MHRQDEEKREGYDGLLNGMQTCLHRYIKKERRTNLQGVYYGGEGNTPEGDCLRLSLLKLLEITCGAGWIPSDYTYFRYVKKGEFIGMKRKNRKNSG